VTTPPAADPPFRHVGIVGAGLIGGSVALAIRRASRAIRITVVDRPDVADHVLAAGAADVAAETVEAMGSACDLVVLATPIPAILATLSSSALSRDTVVTDVGSTKRQIVAAARAAGLTTFVGGHPMAGRERGGFAHASADLFDNRPWLLASEGTSSAALERVRRWVTLLGARPVDTDATTHDRTMAYVSHLPQLLSSLLMRQVDGAVGRPGLASAGKGLEDMTRLAASPSEVWEGILASNADFVSEAASRLAQDLAVLGSKVGDVTEVGRVLLEAREARDRWQSTRRAL
jgi:prephenate dehydrogenase